MNLENTQLIELGGERARKVKIESDFQRNWNKTFSSLEI